MVISNIESNVELGASDLQAEQAEAVKQGVSVETARVWFEGEATPAYILFMPSENRGGIAWSADAEWTAATSISDVAERYIEGDMVA